MKQVKFRILAVLFMFLALAGCQKIDRPELGDYLVDSNPANGPLKFYAAFDGETTNPLMNAVDSIKANFPSDNPLQSIAGVSGKAVMGSAKKFIQYPSFNGWAGSSSFSVSVWIKRDGQTKNNLGDNGPEHIFSFRGSDKEYHWSNAVLFALLEGNNTGCAIKVMAVSPSSKTNPNSSASDNWFEWAGAQAISGLLNNAWNHLVLSYDETTSTLTLYVNGIANPNKKVWASHGAIRFSTSKIGEYRIGRGPRNDDDGDGESGWLQSSFKGGMDQFRLYNKALSAAEVTTLFTNKQ